MTLQQLEYILAVNQFRHFAKAAEYCRVTQPTLSAMIQKLEEELDTRIFDRSQQPVCPTPVGILIIEQAQKILVQANRIKNIIEEEKLSLTGTFKLGILPTVAPYLLPRFFPQLMKKYPDLDIRVIEMKTNDIKKALQTGEIDAGIVASLAGMEELQQTPLFYEQFFVYVSRKDILFNSEVIRTSDPTGVLSRAFGVMIEEEGMAYRGTFLVNPEGKIKIAEIQDNNIGRNADELLRKVEAAQFVATHDGEVCPAKWKKGAATLKPSIDLVGKI